jgi:hypothetical protein
MPGSQPPAIAKPTVEKDTHWDRKHNRKFKERGSMLSRKDGDAVIPYHPRVQTTRTSNKPKKSEKRNVVQSVPDISIPSVISVGNLARLLNVRLGAHCIYCILKRLHVFLRSSPTGDD